MKNLLLPLAIAAAASLVIALGSRFYVFVATDVVIAALYALSVNLLLGYTGLTTFGHAAYFGLGAYVCAIAMKLYSLPFALALPLTFLVCGVLAMPIGFLCVRLTSIYFSMLTLAFAQVAWAICFKWDAVTGGEQGISNVPSPDLSLLASLPIIGNLRPAEQFYLLVIVVVCAAFMVLRRIVDSPFGRALIAIRDNPDRAEFIGINVRRCRLAAFAIAAAFAGLSGALFAVFNRSVFPDFFHWTRSAEALIMALLGGMGSFWGPPIGALVMLTLKQEVTTYTTYWSLVLGLLLLALLLVFPAGIAGTVSELFASRAGGRK